MKDKFRRGLIISLFASCALSGCREASDPVDIPRLTIAAAASLAPAASALRTGFAGIHPQGDAFILEPMDDRVVPAAFDGGGISAVFQWQEPPAEDWSALIGWTGICFAVHPGNPVENISAVQARAIYTGLIRQWEEAGGSSGEIHAMAYESESPWAALFEGVVLAESRLTAGAMIAPSPEAVPAAIAADPQSIGFMMLFQDAPGVRILTVDGASADYPGLLSGAYPFRIPIFLRAREPVAAEILSFAGWAQSVSGQAILMQLQSRE
ncbi:MAG: hypothetical protein JW748_07225 [Anaerolineales bacterium]|nr:hypothetical protein [Anaerolineales bacterium]